MMAKVHYRHNFPGPMQRKSAEYSSSYEGPPLPQVCDAGAVFAEFWGISREQIGSLLQSGSDDMASETGAVPERWHRSWNVRTFVKEFIIPHTKGTGMGYSVLCNRGGPKRVNLMVSHSWEENTEEFLQDLYDHMTSDEIAFVCFLALYQAEDGKGPHIIEQLGTMKIEDGPFYRILCSLSDGFWSACDATLRGGHSFPSFLAEAVVVLARLPIGLANFCVGQLLCAHLACHAVSTCTSDYLFSRHFRSFLSHGRILVIPNESLKANGQGLYSRMWCVCEIAAASHLQVPVFFSRRTVRAHLCAAGSWSSKEARCGNPALPENRDERMIRESVENHWHFKAKARIYFWKCKGDVWRYIDHFLKKQSRVERLANLGTSQAEKRCNRFREKLIAMFARMTVKSSDGQPRHEVGA
eukprot:CAMPEP_0197633488 /NCGR_PEP_ID=MMETSP1338-20131121/9844_1 /TAXON_ID=43686 ORGANISM="Pelagodinium beii, Strain RCC1491" /NCGR_SAMPLE_ID=MMETSP1338 /ASSEMBLY_ACC=CAM_ASM_000754 /LENGTH=411 /DNA_ID=CAMNT_0043205159 /DNA_START=176 /DNA_END=1411 /DNA_ORIENTATION=+